MLAVMIQAFVLTLPLCALPAAGLAYLLLGLGRRIGGKAGMRIGAGLGLLLPVVPLVSMLAYQIDLTMRGNGPILAHADDYKGPLLLAVAAVTTIVVGFALSWAWEGQLLEIDRER